MTLLDATPGALGGPVASGLELRDAIGGRFKDVDSERHQVLVEFPHETVDSFRTVFGQDAFKDSFEKRKPVMCWQHDIRDPIGRAIEAQITPRVNEIRGQFDDLECVPNARRAFHQIESGTITDFSFGFKGAKYERADRLGKGVRRITSAFMAEFSPVTIGSIPGAIATDLREDAANIMELGTILKMRDDGLLTEEGFRELMMEHHPDLLGKLTISTDLAGRDVQLPIPGKCEHCQFKNSVEAKFCQNCGHTLPDPHEGTRDKSGDDYDADDNSGAAAEDMVNGPRWDATQSGTHTATGPNDEILRVKPQVGEGDDANEATGWGWTVYDGDGNKVAEGTSSSDNEPEGAKRAAWSAVKQRAAADYTIPTVVTADSIRQALEVSHPGLALVVAETPITLGDPQMGERAAEGPAATLLLQTRDALAAADTWLAEVNIEELPEGAQQALSLTRASAESVDAVIDALGIRADSSDDDEEDDSDDDSGSEDDDSGSGDEGDSDWDEGDWDGSASNYDDNQWKSATLIDKGGEGTPKERYALPIKTPEGKVSRKGLAAASGRLNQVDAPDEEKQKAAKKIMSLYGKKGMKTPANVLKVAGDHRAAGVSILDDIESRRAR